MSDRKRPITDVTDPTPLPSAIRQAIEQNNPTLEMQQHIHNLRIRYVSSFLQITNGANHPWNKVKLNLMMFPLFLISELEAFHCHMNDIEILNKTRQDAFQETLNHIPATESEYYNNLTRLLRQDFSNGIRDLLLNYREYINLTTTEVQNKGKSFDANASECKGPINEDEIDIDVSPVASLPLELQDHIISFLPNSSSLLTISKTFNKFYLDNRTEALFPLNKQTTNQDILRLPKKIKSISLGPIDRINNDAIQYIKKLQISKFSCAESPHNQDGHYSVEQIFNNAIKGKTLTKLCLSQCFIKDFTVGMDFSKITDLNVSGMYLAPEQLDTILDGERLFEKLNLAGNIIDKPKISKIISSGKNITHLNLAFCLLDHEDIKQIAKEMIKLEYLNISYSRVNPSFSTMEYLCMLSNLKTLIMRGWPIIEAHTGFFIMGTRMRNLKTLDVRLCQAVTKRNLIEFFTTIGENATEYADGIHVKTLNILCDNEGLYDTVNPLTLQLRDILETCTKRIEVLHLCRLFFPPLDRLIHRNDFIGILGNEVQLTFINNKRYLVPQDYLNQMHPAGIPIVIPNPQRNRRRQPRRKNNGN